MRHTDIQPISEVVMASMQRALTRSEVSRTNSSVRSQILQPEQIVFIWTLNSVDFIQQKWKLIITSVKIFLIRHWILKFDLSHLQHVISRTWLIVGICCIKRAHFVLFPVTTATVAPHRGKEGIKDKQTHVAWTYRVQ